MQRVQQGIAGAVFAVLMAFCEAGAAERKECRQFRVTFLTELAEIPSHVMLGDKRIGVVEGGESTGTGQELAVCIDARWAGEIEQHTTCYVSKDRLVVYNVWSSGVDVAEGGMIRGFASRWELAVHEAGDLLGAALRKTLELLRTMTGK